MFLASTSSVFSAIFFIFTPIASRISHVASMSLMFGTFSSVHTPFTSSVAGSIATAAFFAPLIVTSPFSLVFPFYYYFFHCNSPMCFLFLHSLFFLRLIYHNLYFFTRCYITFFPSALIFAFFHIIV